MLQSRHRNSSFVHSHIAVLQFALFFFCDQNVVFNPFLQSTQKRVAQKYMTNNLNDFIVTKSEKNSRTLRFNGKRPAELFSIVS